MEKRFYSFYTNEVGAEVEGGERGITADNIIVPKFCFYMKKVILRESH